MEGWFWSDDRRFLIKKPYFPFKNQLKWSKMGQNDPKSSAGAVFYRLSEVFEKNAPRIANDFLAIFAFPGPPPGKFRKIAKKVDF